MADLHLQDERANREGICGVITRTARYEFICIREEHATSEGRSDVPARHYMVNRWPNRTPLPREDR